jgi:hypothetical protein
MAISKASMSATEGAPAQVGEEGDRLFQVANGCADVLQSG